VKNGTGNLPNLLSIEKGSTVEFKEPWPLFPTNAATGNGPPLGSRLSPAKIDRPACVAPLVAPWFC